MFVNHSVEYSVSSTPCSILSTRAQVLLYGYLEGTLQLNYSYRKTNLLGTYLWYETYMGQQEIAWKKFRASRCMDFINQR